MRRKKNIVIVAMCIAMLFMAVGYALLSTRLDIAGSTVVTSSWKVEFSAIRTVELKGGATNKITPTASGTTANFEVDLVMPGDEVVYEIDITNYGDIVAEVKSATYSGVGSDAIYVRMEGIRKGTLIQSCEGMTVCPKATLILKVGYDANLTEIPKDKTKDISITLNVGQYVPGSPVADGVLIPELAGTSLVQKILSSNKVQSDSGINFGSTTSGYSGLYYTNQNTEGNKTTYYFRGNVENNYVSFAGHLWRVVRINEDGSIRIIKESRIFSSLFAFNSESGYDNLSDNAHVGYMYGTIGSSTYEDTHANINDSTVKKAIDKWYEDNLKDNYAGYLADAGFCNDRSVIQNGNNSVLGVGKNNTSYKASERLASNSNMKPQFACPNPSNDLFTTHTSNKGNRALKYPIGLITADELVYAGRVHGYPAVFQNEMATMTPVYFSTYPILYTSFSDYLWREEAYNGGGYYPVINLASNVRVLDGDGSSGNPYVIG